MESVSQRCVFDWNHVTGTIGTFVDMSKAFDNIWQETPILKLKAHGMERSFIYLRRNYQRVVLKEQRYAA